MGESDDRTIDEDGYERWVSGKKSRTKCKTQETVVSKKSTSKNAAIAADMDIETGLPRRSISQASMSRQTRSGKRSDVNSGAVVEQAGGSFVITEKDYQLLQTLKKQSAAALAGGLLPEGEASCERQKASSKSKEAAASAEDMGRELRGGIALSRPYLVQQVEKGQRCRRGQGKDPIHSLPFPVEEVSEEEEFQENRGLMQGSSFDDENGRSCDEEGEQTSDSDFQTTAQEILQGAQKIGGKVNCGRPKPAREDDDGGVLGETRFRDGRRQVQFEDGNTYEGGKVLQELAHKRKGIHVKEKVMTTPCAGGRRREMPSKGGVTFLFEMSIQEDDFHNEAGGGPLRTVGNIENDDDDFQEPPAVGSSNCKVRDKQLLTESEARAIRKRKKTEREVAVLKREAAGEKPYYIMVNARGEPYGDGMTAWRAEVNKLCRALDPSIRDIRQQPHQKIQILKRRLTNNFEYSGVISDKYLLPLVGHRMSIRRNELINRIKAGREKPPGVDGDAWKKLASISESPNFRKKSDAMRYANSCRQNLGRTGPCGEIGVRENLKDRLGRSPDPDKVEAEMSRDKGYGGKKKIITVGAAKQTANSSADGNIGERKGVSSEDSKAEEVDVKRSKSMYNTGGEVADETRMYQMELIRKMEAEIHDLKSRMQGDVCIAASSTAKAIPEAGMQAMKGKAPTCRLEGM